MKTLEKQAEEYFEYNIFCDGITPFEEEIGKRCFMAGANSNWVQAEKIKAQIELLYRARVAPISWFDQKMEELNQQLKELEDDSQSRLL
jgi:hypothetical protein